MRRRGAEARLLLPFILAVALSPVVASAADLLAALTDPEDPALEASVDIVSARVEQENGRLTFTMQLRGAIPSELPDPDDTQTYLWLLDTDGDAGTGQPHGELGSEFNVRAVVGQTWGGGWVDVTGAAPGGGEGTVTVDGNTISIRIWLSQVDTPDGFDWRCSTLRECGGSSGAGNAETGVAHAAPLPYTPPARVTVTTPILELCPGGPATGQLQVVIRDAAGQVLPDAEHEITYHSTNEAVATVDGDGLVTAVMPPEFHWQTPYIEVWADGVMADNSAVIRVNALDVGVVNRTHEAAHVAFVLPDVIEEVDLAALTAQYEVVEATDLAYAAQAIGLGTVPTNGGTEYFVLDVAVDPATSVCGASGNPIRLGWTWGLPANNSCYIINDPANRMPQWFVLWHEMGHNFTAACNSFNMFLWTPSGTHNSAYGEGLASLAALWSWRMTMDSYSGLGPLAHANIDDHFCGQWDRFRSALTDYCAAGRNYDAIDADVVDGILMEMWGRYGMKSWYDLFSTFLPSAEPMPLPIDTKEKQATWFVAAMSVSAGEDLRESFATDYGFPIDEAAWPDIMSVVQARIGARVFGIVAVPDPAVRAPGRDRMLPSAPNPFNPRTEVRFALAAPGPVGLTIHDARGRRVATLLAGFMPAGEHAAAWEGRDDAGRAVASGTYLARLVTATGVVERKLTIVK
jgi:hypothetical protein